MAADTLKSFASVEFKNGALTPVVVPGIPSGIYAWRVSLDLIEPDLERLSLSLSADERTRAQRFHFLRDRSRFVAGRAILRALLGDCLDRDPASLEFVYGPMSKPLLASEFAGSMHFNLSHSDGVAVYALSADYELGVDVERIRPVPEAESILRTHFPAGTVERWQRLPLEQRMESFYQSWVQLEAIAKREGCGLAGLEDSPERFAEAGSFIQFIPAPGYVGALAWRTAENPG